MVPSAKHGSLKTYLIYTLLFACTYSSECFATTIQAEVRPVRIIYVDYADQITTVISNTNQTVEPTVEYLGAPHFHTRLTTTAQKEYQRILYQYDFSRPITINIKNITGIEMLMNVILNNLKKLKWKCVNYDFTF